jgi:predicted metal-dependent hydrolase
MFVVLHEIAHLMTTTVGHTPEFWANFRRILKDAVAAGIYQETNYARNPVRYCGMTITDTPL